MLKGLNLLNKEQICLFVIRLTREQYYVDLEVLEENSGNVYSQYWEIEGSAVG